MFRFFICCSVLLCSFPVGAQRFRKIEKEGIACRKSLIPDSLSASDAVNHRLTLCAGNNDGKSIVSYFHKNENFGTGKSLYFSDGSFSVNVYRENDAVPVETYDSKSFPNDEIIALCKRYGVNSLDFFFYK